MNHAPAPSRIRRTVVTFLLGALAAVLVLIPSTTGAFHASSSAAGSSVHTATSASVPTTQEERVTEQAIARVTTSVVTVKNVGNGLGSGVITTSDGYIVTNNHVVAGAKQIKVTLANGSTVSATIRGKDPLDDLAVVKIDGSNLPAATYGSSSALQVGETVLAIGNPLGITRTVTSGIVSAVNRTVREGQGGGSIPDAIQTSAPINPGNSGGALINLAGQVVGIPTLTAVDPEFNAPAVGIGFAIPSNRVVDIAQQIIRYGKVIHTGRAALGIYAATVSGSLAQTYNLPVSHGVLIARFSSNSAAKQAGLKAGEIIVALDGKPITNESTLFDTLATHRPGQKVWVKAVAPHGKTITRQVTLREMPANATG
jgi:S1-C subfamily serine protease